MSLVIVNVRSELPVSTAAMGWAVAPIPQEVFDWQVQYAQKAVSDAEDIVHSAEPKVKVIGEVICGSAVQTLIDLSKDALMIVVGCRGLDALERGFARIRQFGVVHHGHCPIAVIHTESQGWGLRRITRRCWSASMVLPPLNWPPRSPSTKPLFGVWISLRCMPGATKTCQDSLERTGRLLSAPLARR